MRRSPLALIAAAALSGCVWHFNALNGPPQPPSPPASLQFIAFGDAGSGGERQAAVGRAMARVCADRGCAFALELGDNFYPAGAHSADDPQFQSAFEKPYELFNMPVYVVLGNHDNGSAGGEGNNNARGNFEVQYQSPKWKMPARYYKLAFPAESAEPFAEFFGLDSSPLAPYALDPDPKWAPATYGAQQLAWLQQGMLASRASWKIVFAHHPYISNGLHGDAGSYSTHPGDAPAARGEQWKALIDQGVCANHADLYLSGHDHDLEWLKPVHDCGNTQFIVSGAAAPVELRSFAKEPHDAVYWHADQTAGFFWIKLEQNRMTVAAFTLNAKDELPAVTQHGHPLPTYEQSVQRLP